MAGQSQGTSSASRVQWAGCEACTSRAKRQACTGTLQAASPPDGDLEVEQGAGHGATHVLLQDRGQRVQCTLGRRLGLRASSWPARRARELVQRTRGGAGGAGRGTRLLGLALLQVGDAVGAVNLAGVDFAGVAGGVEVLSGEEVGAPLLQHVLRRASGRPGHGEPGRRRDTWCREEGAANTHAACS